MEDNFLSPIIEGRITDIRFSVATQAEICVSSVSEGPINHVSQLTNPFLGLPLESGKCESCGTAEPGKCEGHFGYIQLPIPIYHPCHVNELKKLLSLVCLNCRRLKRGKNIGSEKSRNTPCLYCPDIPRIVVNEDKTTDGVVLLELKLSGNKHQPAEVWRFLDQYGYRYGNGKIRTLLPCEVLEILKKISEDTRKKLAAKGFFTQDGYIIQNVPVPPNCLSIPDISDGVSVMSSDISVSMLKKVIKQGDTIRCSRSGRPNFESHRVEVNDLQSTVAQYFRARGTSKDARDVKMSFGLSKEADESATKAWLEKMRTLFMSKGSGYCSRSVITGDAYKRVDEIGLPLEVAKMITFEEKVTQSNMAHLQDLVDQKLCLTYKDGDSTYSLREGSKGHTQLRVGQVIHRRVMDGDILFINRPPSTHKHSLQALSVYIHEDHTVKINPLICGPLDADFDGDCVHLFYPQSLAARAEVVELFSVEKQLLSSHTGKLNLQLKNDSLLSLKMMFKKFFLNIKTSQQLAMFLSTRLPGPALLKNSPVGPQWTVLQILQSTLPAHFDCSGERYFISESEILKLDYNRDVLQSMLDEIISSVFFEKGPKEALTVYNTLQPLLMEHLFSEGYSVSLYDFSLPYSVLADLPGNIERVSPLLHHLRLTYNELVEMQVGNHLRSVKAPVVNFILKASGLGNLIDSKSESSINKVVEQIGFLGLQLADRGKFYSRNLVEDMTSLFLSKFAVNGVEYPSEAFGLIKSCFFHGLNPYENLVHSISSREVLVRSSRGLTEPGTLFKNLMTILRDVVICYDGTVRNICNNSVIQFKYGVEAVTSSDNFYPAGEPIGALAATAISNPAYKAVLDSSSSSNTSWNLMKDVLVCKVNFANDHNDRRVILYLKDCSCVKNYCKENAAYIVHNQLKKIALRDISVDFLIEYQNQQYESSERSSSLVGHIHLDKKRLKELNRNMHDIYEKCQEIISQLRRSKKNKLSESLKNVLLSVSDCCCFQQSNDPGSCQIPCLQFSWKLDTSALSLEIISQVMANVICPILLDTVVKGDRRVCSTNIIWISPDSSTWVENDCKAQPGELALEIVLEKDYVKKHGDAWRIALDSCLPVIHLIDTRRSIPYAIRQVQEVLGISCAFDQAVQRLSKSIRMVNKGVQKEHLILAASSMTCTGSLIGFNKSGYRALFRSLNVQIPFTEATLFTPRKCFERAAEKCHTDTLSGIVASSAWGKHVAVGSGTRFEILWNKNEMGSVQNVAIDIYNFLQLVRNPNAGSHTSYLGEDYEDIEIGNRMDDDLCMSPEQNFDSSTKPTFDDAELIDHHESEDFGKSGESSWNVHVSGGKSGGSEWNFEQNGDAGWGANANDKPSNDADAWGKPAESDTNGWGSSKKPSEGETSAGWGKKSTNTDAWGKPAESDTNGWGSSKKPSVGETSAGWGSAEPRELASKDPVDGWGKKSTNTDADAWGKPSESDTNGWGSSKKPSEGETSAGWGSAEPRELPSKDPVDGWGKKSTNADANGWGSSQKATEAVGWGATESQKLSSEEPADAWGAQRSSGGGKPQEAWGKPPQVKTPEDAWGKPPQAKESSGWGKSAKENEPNSSAAWGKGSEKTESSGGWGAPEKEKEPKSSSGGWGNSAKPTESSGGWGQAEKEDLPTSSTRGQNQGSWGKSEATSSSGWGNPQASNVQAESSWGKSAGETESSDGGGWGKSVKEHETNTKNAQAVDSWGKSAEGWGKSVNENESNTKNGQADDSWGKGGGGWGKIVNENETNTKNGQADSSWGKNSTETEADGGGWGKPPEENQQSTSGGGGWGKRENQNQETESSGGGWGKNGDTPGWGAKKGDEQGWGRGRSGGRGRGRGRDSSMGSRGGGWGNSADWKTPGRGQSNDWNARPQYTPEEQKIFSDVDPIMQSIKRIMHQSGYNNEDRLSADDQSYILENVFNYHPEKDTKIGTGLDHFMISAHTKFQGTKCLYIVTADGHKEDFSYRKCLENFAKEKHSPEIAASFLGKYFGQRKPPREDQPPVQYSAEEQPVLAEVEGIMQSIKRIMHQSGYNDDDRLSADDQSFVLDNILSYHPDKQAKIGAGVDYVTISRHTNFQGTRCLYIVSTDGRKEDFSYRKCLEHYVREKHPEVAESFVAKYFAPRKPRAGGGGGWRDDQSQPSTPHPATPATPQC